LLLALGGLGAAVRSTMKVYALAWVAVAAVCAGACSSVWGFDDLVVGDGGAGDEARMEAAGSSSGSSGGSSGSSGSGGGSSGSGSGSGGSSGGDSGDASVVTVYHDMTNPSFWSVFDTTGLSANARGFFGGAFDGRYVYFVPSNDTLAARYDTKAVFTSAGSWQTFDTASINAASVGYRGGAFDGRYVYLVPFYNSTASMGAGVVARFDSQATFTAAASWATFDTTTVVATAEGYDGAVFDGRYLYFVPHLTGTVARYDTKAAFAASSSWATFDLLTINANSAGFLGAAYDGRYVYLVPNGDGEPLAVCDTQGDFTGSAWNLFDVQLVNQNAGSFLGGAFDGSHVYLAPFPTGTNPGTLALRYDVTAGLKASSFSTFDTSGLGQSTKGYAGAAFDGRYIYMAPSASSLVARYDDTASFGVASSWGTFDLSKVSAVATAYYGAVFDGQFVYFVPASNGTVARFDAKTPPSMPKLPGWNGSFL
jgi:hypothetical protein